MNNPSSILLLGASVPFAGLDPAATAILGTLLWLIPLAIIAILAFALLSLPYRRLERARFFLDLLANGLSRGQRPEVTIMDLARSQDPALGVRFHQLAARIEKGESLASSLSLVPSLLPPQVLAAIRAGLETGNLERILPAGQKMLGDGPAQTRHLLHYVIVLLTTHAPSILGVIILLKVLVLPKFRQITADLSDGLLATPRLGAIDVATFLAVGMVVVCVLIVLGIILHVGGPGMRRWWNNFFPFLPHTVSFAIPWKRQRMLRDFAGVLGVLLDAQIPEERALIIAADCTANRIFQRRAEEAAAELRAGRSLPEVLHGFDTTGELQWRMANAARGHRGFDISLAGWRETLDAKAFQHEQATAHVASTALVLMNGLLVGMVVVAMFGVLVQLIDTASLW